MRLVRLATCALLLVAGSVHAAPLDRAVVEMLENFSLPVPNPPNVVVCHGFGCTYRTLIGLGPRDVKQLQKLMAGAKASPEAERHAIGAVYAWFEQRVAPEAGTAKAVARTSPRYMRDPEQFDCFDKTHNATELLALLEHFGLLHHHVIDVPQSRGVPILLQHTTAVIREKTSGQRWSVDGWTRSNGERPDIFPMEYWAAQN
ncbi:MAG: hypothetical protein E6G97_23510 [Alphaproteobacteria bacterium]|nr:MAG: hypothetical protein E6G97_23510 [Alphaproteobacteria bacterium]